jgi:alginate O-acetyltransferase complex protein AlgI
LRFDDVFFLFQFLPSILALYFLARAADTERPVVARWAGRVALAIVLAGGLWLVQRTSVGGLLIAFAAAILVMAATIERLRARPDARVLTLGVLITATAISAGVLVYTRSRMTGPAFALSGVVVLICHGLAYVTDVYRGQASTRQPLESALYLIQFPVLPAGPLIRFRDFSANLPKLATVVGLGSFTYGVRRVIIGLVKVVLVAGTLAEPVDAIMALAPARLSASVAWLAALCVSLSYYFWLSGYADIAIGLGRMLGFRYPENFRRPYTADSVREFWRRWSVTSITWLRDYLSLPIAGRDVPTPRLFINIVIGFTLLGLWHGGGQTVWIWALYSGAWLALEAVTLSHVIERLPRAIRHVYVLTVVVFGWVILRGDTPAALWEIVKAMAGLAGGRTAYTASRYLTWPVEIALFVAIIGAGPLVPWISRWRVTLDATTAAVVMMISAFSLFAWRLAALAREAIRTFRPRRS